MTREEIEQLVGAEVDRRLGGMVGQIGKDLEDRYTTKDDVEKAIEARIQHEATALNIALRDIVNRLRRDEKVPDDHPLAVVFKIMEDIADLEFRVMEIGMYVVADNLDLTRGDGTVEHAMRLTLLKRFVTDREHGRMCDMLERAKKTDPSQGETISSFAEILGPRPEGPG